MDNEKPIENSAPQLPNLEGRPAAEHISGAQHLLKSLREKIGEHPELGEAITELEMALSILTVKTAGML